MPIFGKTKPPEGMPEKAGKPRVLLLIAGAIVGIFLLLLGNGNIFPAAQTEVTPPASSVREDAGTYRAELEQQVKTLCESVRGVDHVTVVITLSGNFEEIYATESVNGKDSYVIVGSGSSASALHISVKNPEIAGIGIVCRGAENADVRRELTSLICAAFRIPSNRIYITEAKN